MYNLSYRPIITPAHNIFLKQKWDQAVFRIHREKVKKAKAVVDNKPPKTHMHLHIKVKKLQSEAEQLAIIERDNRLLLEKMADIMRSGGLVDHRKYDHVHKSLNKTMRQRELLRITHENFALLKRITAKQPQYSHKRWLMEWRVNQQFMMNIARMPHAWRDEQQIMYDTWKEEQSEANMKIREGIRADPPRYLRQQKLRCTCGRETTTPHNNLHKNNLPEVVV